MPTAACGINCDVCGLNKRGICSSCGSGISRQGMEKIAIQTKLFGQPCPILACAHMNHLEFCMRDCNSFPCENFENQGYPFSQGFLNMQRRRLAEISTKAIPKISGAGDWIVVPSEHWDNLQKRDPAEICNIALAQLETTGDIRLRVLNTDFFIHPKNRSIRAMTREKGILIRDPLLELIIIVYLTQITSAPLRHEKAGVKDLKSAHFFQGPHELEMEPVLARYGNDASGFRKVAGQLDGRFISSTADAGVVFSPFP
ncbi:MAG: DUF3786 domain-containing protein, partial [Deltaproteobacteria bacterium]